MRATAAILGRVEREQSSVAGGEERAQREGIGCRGRRPGAIEALPISGSTVLKTAPATRRDQAGIDSRLPLDIQPVSTLMREMRQRGGKGERGCISAVQLLAVAAWHKCRSSR